MGKIKGRDLDAIKTAVGALDTKERRDRYRAGNFPRSQAVKDLDKRYRWDLFYGAQRQGLTLEGWDDYLDAHIYTALKSVVPSLSEK